MPAHFRVLISFLAVFSFSSSFAARSETLQGGVETVEVLPKFNLKLDNTAKLDMAKLSFKPDCLCFNPSLVEIAEEDGKYKLMEGDKWLIYYGSKGDAAKSALALTKAYKWDQMCWLGSSSPGKMEFQYFLVGGDAPAGAAAGEDCLFINPDNCEVKEIDGRWKIVEGDVWHLDFAARKQLAEQALDVLRYYGFKRICYTGRPYAPMMYLRK